MIGRYNDNIYSMSVKQPDIKKIYKIDFVVKTYNKRMFKGLSSYVTSLQNEHLLLFFSFSFNFSLRPLF